MRVDEGVDLDRVAGRWIISVDRECSACGEPQMTHLLANDVIEWLQRYAPELLKEAELSTTLVAKPSTPMPSPPRDPQPCGMSFFCNIQRQPPCALDIQRYSNLMTSATLTEKPAAITIVVRMMNDRGEPSTADFVDGPNHAGTWRKAYAIARPAGRKIKKSNPTPGWYFLDCYST